MISFINLIIKYVLIPKHYIHLIELEGDCGCQEERSRGDGENKFHSEKPLNDLLS